ncbi:MAG: glycerophosphodiester phosphodiesterase family protein, partial [Spirochaetales bacterium]|nr:glycerophosphodiester phosphodiesterase family protein [Spirochaetales bacterium]
AIEFYIAALFNKKDYQKPCSVLQVFYGKPYYKFGINLATAKVINYAHSQDMAIQYWTVNEDDEIEYLIKAGADAVITDNVKRAVEIKSNLQK